MGTLTGCADVFLVPPDGGILMQADAGVVMPGPDSGPPAVDASQALDTGFEELPDSGAVDSGFGPAIVFTEDDCVVPARNEGWWAVALHDGPQGPVVTSSEAVSRAAMDICWIRQLEERPLVQSEIWGDYLIVRVVDGADTREFERLKHEYGAVREERRSPAGPLSIWFDTRYNIPALARVFGGLEAVAWAEADPFFLGYNNRYEYRIEATGLWRWMAYERFHDAFWQCGYRRIETYLVDHVRSSVRFADESFHSYTNGSCPYPWAASQGDR